MVHVATLLILGAVSLMQVSVVVADALGCYRDVEEDRDLWDDVIKTHENSPASCIDHCKSRGYAYAAVQGGIWCECGNSYGKHGALDLRKCNWKCSGDSSLYCGGSFANNVFSTTNTGDVCGTVLNGTSGTFTSPGYHESGTYPNYLECDIVISAGRSDGVEIKFHDFYLESCGFRPGKGYPPYCSCDSVQIIYGKSGVASDLISKLCGEDGTDVHVITVYSNEVIIRFTTDVNNQRWRGDARGFSASYKQVMGGERAAPAINIAPTTYKGLRKYRIQSLTVLDRASGTFTSPGYDSGSYPDLLECDYIISADADHGIEITFHDIDLENGDRRWKKPHGPCCDTVEIFYGTDDWRTGGGEGPPLISKLCATSTPPKFTVYSSNEILIRFTSDQGNYEGDKNVAKRGFSASYKQVMREKKANSTLTYVGCNDKSSECKQNPGVCTDNNNSSWARHNCARSCGFCTVPCEDKGSSTDYCNHLLSYCELERHKAYMKENCYKTCGYCEDITTTPLTIPDNTKTTKPVLSCNFGDSDIITFTKHSDLLHKMTLTCNSPGADKFTFIRNNKQVQSGAKNTYTKRYGGLGRYVCKAERSDGKGAQVFSEIVTLQMERCKGKLDYIKDPKGRNSGHCFLCRGNYSVPAQLVSHGHRYKDIGEMGWAYCSSHNKDHPNDCSYFLEECLEYFSEIEARYVQGEFSVQDCGECCVDWGFYEQNRSCKKEREAGNCKDEYISQDIAYRCRRTCGLCDGVSAIGN